MTKAELSSMVVVTDPEDYLFDNVSAHLTKLAEAFPDRDLSSIAKVELKDGQKTLHVARGWAHLVMGDVSDLRNVGPMVEIHVNDDQLDERDKYQKALVKKALASDEGILVAPTGAGKTVVIVLMIDALKRRTLVLTHTTEIAGQIRKAFKTFTGIEAGYIGSGTRDVRPVTVGLIQSVRSDDPVLQSIGCLIIDEAHHISAASYLRVLEKCPAKHRYGLTATIKKTGEEEKIIYAAIGPVLGKIEVGELQEQGFLNKGSYRPVYTNAVASRFEYVSSRCWYYKSGQKEGVLKKCPSPCTYPIDDEIEKCVYEKGYYGWIYEKLSKDSVRNAKLVDAILGAMKDHPWTVVLTHRKNHAKLIRECLDDHHADTGRVWLAIGAPEMKKKEARAAIDGYKAKGGVLIATSQMLGEGFDAPKTSCLVRAMPAGGKVSVRQQTGRVMRPQEKPSLIIDFVDHRILWLKRMWLGRQSIYKTLGFTPEVKEMQPDLFK